MLPLTSAFTLFPYTTLFRSERGAPERERFEVSLHRECPRRIGGHEIEHGFGRVERDCRFAERRGVPSRSAPEIERSEEHTSELQSLTNLVCRLLLEKKKKNR